MANTRQARKRVQQAEKRRGRNFSLRSKVRTLVKHVVHAVAEEDKTAAREAYIQATKVIDQATNKGLLHKNTAARHKSRLNTRIRALG